VKGFCRDEWRDDVFDYWYGKIDKKHFLSLVEFMFYRFNIGGKNGH
jgi:hypothetical protein